MLCDFSNYFQLPKKRHRTIEEWDDRIFESLVKTNIEAATRGVL